jgi:ParB family chromosome partitioning protein
MGRKLFEKANLIGTLQPPQRGTNPSEADGAKPRTAPGTMMGFLSAQSSAMQEAEHSKDRIKELEDAQPLRRIDPKEIRPSRWANRHEASFSTVEFEELKREIAESGGNVQPIKVRPVQVLNGSTHEEIRFEIVFGHRRHRACLELGMPVLATIEQVNDLQLFEQMERENRGRKNLSAWEQGVMYRNALDEGLYPSLRQLSAALGIDVSLVSKSVTLARLPEPVLKAFSSPLEIQFRWAAGLSDAMQRDPEGVIRRASEWNEKAELKSGSAVYEHLISSDVSSKAKPTRNVVNIKVAGKVVATLDADSKGRDLVQFKAPLAKAKREQLAVLLAELLTEK